MNIRSLQIAHHSYNVDLQIQEGVFTKIFKSKTTEPTSIGFPGLINMHDHLAFNAFEPLKHKLNLHFSNHIKWANYIRSEYEGYINEISKIPREVREGLGEFKNISNGFTSVSDHESKKGKCLLIDNFTDYKYLHSVPNENNWKLKFLLPYANSKPWFIHLGEGIDSVAEKEADKLLNYNLWGKSIIAIHGIALTEKQLKKINNLIWCPNSNLYLYDRTINNELLLRSNKKILFGSDSTISSDPNIWNHIRQAANHIDSVSMVYEMLTTNPSYQIPSFKKLGSIAEGQYADLIIADKKYDDFYDCFYNLNPQNIKLVIKKGRVIWCREDVFDQKMFTQLKKIPGTNYFLDLKLYSVISNYIQEYPHLLFKV